MTRLLPIAAAALLTLSAPVAMAQDRTVTAHPHGYIPTTVPARTKLVLRPRGLLDFSDPFHVYVTPNIVPQREARQRASQVAAAHCRATTGSPTARLVETRYTELDLGSWGYRGYCG